MKTTLTILVFSCLLVLSLQGNFQCNVANCQSCSSPNTCGLCNQNFVLMQIDSIKTQSFCQAVNCSTGCAKCNQTNICQVCFDNYTLTKSSTCLLCNVSNCAQCSAPNFCQTCNSLNGTQLFPSTNGGVCIACNTSTSNLLNCLSCNAPNSCGQCKNNFQLYIAPNTTIGVCILCNIQNCQSCGLNGNATVCLTCSPGYSAVSGMCVQCLYPCTTCTSGLIPNNCATCSTPTFFQKATTNGTCVVNLIPNCVSYNPLNTTQCNGCATGYSYNGTANSCIFSCSSNCLICSSSNSCIACNPGFYLKNNNTCSQCQVTGCSACTNNGTICTRCFAGFYYIEDECRACPGYCSTCVSSSFCTSLVQPNQRALVQIGNQTLLAVCQQNCKTCSNVNPQVCLECQSGFVLNNGNCLMCSIGCLTCNNINLNQCLSCYPNSFLLNNTCIACTNNCLTCVSANQTSSCTSCSPGFYLSNSKCIQGCPLNCITCISSNNCLMCASGYTLFKSNLSNLCVPCTTSCRTCAEGQPASCLSCGAGFYLNGNTCLQCSINCLTCTASGCLSCLSGFFLTSAQTCSQNCQLPCATCSAIISTKCTSCIAGYSYNSISGSCTQITSCNGSCSVCPFGFTLNQGQCIACNISQCQTCSTANKTQCLSCVPGFYLQSGISLCLPCPIKCATCLTGSGCLTCAAGYTQIANVPQMSGGFQCVACNNPCATCINSPDYCTSCIPGYKFFGWKCSQSFYFGFQLTLLANITTFNRNYYSFLTTLSNTIGSTNPNAITILSISEGSVIIQGGAGPTGVSGTQQVSNQFNNFVSTLSQSNVIAGMPVGQAQISVVGGYIDYDQEKANLALILGICIPVVVLLIVGIVVFIYYKKRRLAQNYQEEKNNKEDTGANVRESFQISSP